MEEETESLHQRKGTSFRTFVVKLDDICQGNLTVIVAFATVCEISCS